jgi:hypothetical protein
MYSNTAHSISDLSRGASRGLTIRQLERCALVVVFTESRTGKRSDRSQHCGCSGTRFAELEHIGSTCSSSVCDRSRSEREFFRGNTVRDSAVSFILKRQLFRCTAINMACKLGLYKW